MDFILGVIVGAAGVGMMVLALRHFNPSQEIHDWTEEAYSKPQAITRIPSKHLDWEIK